MGIGTFIERDSASSSAPRRAVKRPSPGLGAFAETDNASSTVPRATVPKVSTKGVTFIDGAIPPPPPIPVPIVFTYFEIVNGVEYFDIENGERYYETVF